MRVKAAVAACTACVIVGGDAFAAPLKWEGSVITLTALSTPLVTTGTGVATVNSSSGYGHLNRIFLTGQDIGQTTTLSPTGGPTTGIVASKRLGTGTLLGSGSGVGGTLPFEGQTRVCFGGFGGCVGATGSIVVPFDGVTGVGGTQVRSLPGGVRVSVFGNPWTLGMTSATGVTANGATTIIKGTGFAHGPASLTSSTALPSGTIQWVTATMISTNVTTDPMQGTVTALRLHFVPEPGLLVLLGSGVAGLLVLAWHRMD